MYKIAKMFLLYSLNDMVFINLFEFSWFKQSIQGFCFQRLLLLLSIASKIVNNKKKNAREFKILAIYIFIVSSLYLTLHCNKCFLLWNWTKLEIFVNKYPIFYSICIWKYKTKIRYEERAFGHLHLFLV